MILDNKPYTFDRVTRIIIVISVCVGSIIILQYLSPVLIPFAIAGLLAYLINPLVVLIKSKIKYNVLAVALAILLVISVFSLIGWIVLPIILKQFISMGQLLSQLIINSNLAKQAAERLPENIWKITKEFLSESNAVTLFQTENFWIITKDVIAKVIPGMLDFIGNTKRLLLSITGMAIIMLYLVFLLLDFQRLRENWSMILPPMYRETVTDFINDFNMGMKRYFRGQALIASTVGVLFAIGFTIIGLPMGIVVGLFIGLLNMVPYLQIIGIIPAYILGVLLALQTGGSFLGAIGLVTIVFIVVQSFQDYFLVPKIMGKVTGLHPWMILLSLSIWGRMLGFFGLIIALPMTALLLAYYRRFILKPAITVQNK